MKRFILAAAIAAGAASQAQAIVIDNDIPSGTLGHLEYDIVAGGDTRDGDITGQRFTNGTLITTEFVFDYFHYVDVGATGSAVRLNASASSGPTLSADDEVSSGGRFLGEAGNPIDWTSRSYLNNGDSRLFNVITFTAVTGALGAIDLIAYVDQDVLGVSDDVLFSVGSAANSNLQVFTVDDAEIIGVSQSGSYSALQGLANASFKGWAADEYSDLRSAITSGGAAYSPTGVIDLVDLPQVARPNLPDGIAYGPADVTTALAWSVSPGATTATIITVLGGVPDISSIPEPTSLASLALFGLMLRRRA